VLADNSGSRLRAGRWRQRQTMAVAPQNFGRFFDQPRTPAQPARAWIINEQGIPVGCDGERSGFLVKL